MAAVPDIKVRFVAEGGNVQSVVSGINASLGQLQGAATKTSASLERAATIPAGTGASSVAQVDAIESALGRLAAKIVSVGVLWRTLAPADLGFKDFNVFEANATEFKTRQGLKFATGDTKIAAEEYAFLRKTSDELGQSFKDLAPEYVKLAAAAKGTALEGQETRNIFLGLSRASATLGLSNADLEGAFRAVQQMISKGKISSEELRQQLGERLPGTIQIFSKALGVSTKELEKLLEKGELASVDVIPSLSRSINSLFQDSAAEGANGPIGRLNKFKNALFDLQIKIGQSGFTDAATSGLDALGRVAQLTNNHVGELKVALGGLLGLFVASKIISFSEAITAKAKALAQSTIESRAAAAATREALAADATASAAAAQSAAFARAKANADSAAATAAVSAASAAIGKAEADVTGARTAAARATAEAALAESVYLTARADAAAAAAAVPLARERLVQAAATQANILASQEYAVAQAAATRADAAGALARVVSAGEALAAAQANRAAALSEAQRATSNYERAAAQGALVRTSQELAAAEAAHAVAVSGYTQAQALATAAEARREAVAARLAAANAAVAVAQAEVTAAVALAERTTLVAVAAEARRNQSLEQVAIAERAAAVATENHTAAVAGLNAARAAGAAAAARAAAATEAEAVAQRAATVATDTHAASKGRLAAVSGALTGALGLVGGPLGAILLLLTVGATAWSIWGNSAADAATKAGQTTADLEKRLRMLRAEAEHGVNANSMTEIQDNTKQLIKDEAKLAEMKKKRAEVEETFRRSNTTEFGASKFRKESDAEIAEQERRVATLKTINEEIASGMERRKAAEKSGSTAGTNGNSAAMLALVQSFGDLPKLQKLEEELVKFDDAAKRFSAARKGEDKPITDAEAKEIASRRAELVRKINEEKSKGAVTVSSVIGFERAELQADKRRAAALLAEQKAELATQTQLLEDNHRDGLVSIERYWDERTRIAREGAQNEIAYQESIIRAAKQEKIDIQRAPVKTDADRLRLKQEEVRIDGEIAAAEERVRRGRELQTAAEANRLREIARGRLQESDTQAQLVFENEKLRGNFDPSSAFRAAVASNRKALQDAIANESEFPQLREQLEIKLKLTVAKESIDQVERDIKLIEERQADRERTIQLQILSGTLTELEGRRAVIQVHKETADALDALVPKYAALAREIGNPQTIQQVEALKVKIKELRVVQDDMAKQFDQAGENAIARLFTDIANESKNASEAIANFGRGLLRTFNDIIAQNLAKSLYSSLFGGEDSAGKSLSSGVKAIGALFGLNIGTGGGTSGDAFAAGNFATGGYITGPGTATSDSIPTWLSNGEYVINAARVAQLGQPFMEWINGDALPPRALPSTVMREMNSAKQLHRATGGPIGDMPNTPGSAYAGGAGTTLVIDKSMLDMTFRDAMERFMANEVAVR
jgi:tape measure domain-containing protein